LSGGVDTDLFRPDAFDREALTNLRGGAGRGPEQRKALEGALSGSRELLESLREISGAYEPRAHDRDAGERLGVFLDQTSPLVVYVGKLIHSKGVHCLISAFARVREETGARLLVIGFGTFREGLEALARALSKGDEKTVESLAELGKLLEGETPGPLEHFEVSEGLMRKSAGMADSIEFIGPLGHRELAKALPAADVAVVPSIFPEIFGLVAAEFAASGVVPFVANHSGLGEAGGIVGDGLPFDLRVGMDNFEEDLSDALIRYLSLPQRERERCSDIARRNAVEDLSWRSLAEQIVDLAKPGGMEE
ncbi:MAG: glycosyltransferase, partial [Rubrobacteraceae bacterium]